MVEDIVPGFPQTAKGCGDAVENFVALKVFYAWQSDRSSNVNRGLIRNALDAAVKKVKADPDILEPKERDIEIDHDTKGVSGSPHIAETIFQKIAACDVFVADLTLVSAKRARRPAPNPNVLVEYGYAFRTLGERRIIGICNEAFGPIEKLPFDIRSRSCLKYHAIANTDKALVRKQLASMLATQFKQVISDIRDEKVAEEDKQRRVHTLPESFLPPSDLDGLSNPSVETGNHYLVPSTFPWPWRNGELGYRLNAKPGQEDVSVKVETRPHLHFRLETENASQRITVAQTVALARTGLRVFGNQLWPSTGFARNNEGAVVFACSNETPNVVETATQLFRNGEIWGVDFYLLRSRRTGANTPHHRVPVKAVERDFTASVEFSTWFAKEQSKLPPPVRLTVGLEGVDGYYLQLDKNLFGKEFVGPLTRDSIGKQFTLDHLDPQEISNDLLIPFFEEIYDAAGLVRPTAKTQG